MTANAQQALINLSISSRFASRVSVLLNAWLGSAGLAYRNPALSAAPSYYIIRDVRRYYFLDAERYTSLPTKRIHVAYL